MSAITLGLFAAFCWALHDITVRRVSQHVPLMGALLIVLLVGTFFQFLAYIWMEDVAKLPSSVLILSVGTGLCFLIANLSLYMAFKRGPVKLVAPIIASYPILSVFIAFLEGASVSIGQALAVLAIITGVGFVAAWSDRTRDKTPSFGPTIAVSLLASLGFGMSFWLGQQATAIAGEFSTTLVARVSALLILILLMIGRKRTSLPNKSAWLPLGLMGILDGLALLSVVSAGDKPNPEYAAVASSMFGLLTVVLAVFFLKERMVFLQWVAVGVAFGGIGYLAL